jgi:hypothetical protein
MRRKTVRIRRQQLRRGSLSRLDLLDTEPEGGATEGAGAETPRGNPVPFREGLAVLAPGR